MTVVTPMEWPDPCPDVSRALGPHLAGSSPSTDHGLGCEQTSWGPLPEEARGPLFGPGTLTQ